MTTRGRFVLAAISGLCACTAGPADGPPGEPWRGEVVSYVVDRGPRSEIEHRLRSDDGTIHRLVVQDPAGLTPGSRIRVWGPAEGDAIQVRHHQVDELPVQTHASALVAGQKKPTRKWAFVLLDVSGGGNPINKTNAQDVLFSPNRPDSIRSYFREVSYGVQDVEGEVLGPLPYNMGGRCDTDRLAAALLPQIAARYDQYLWFFGTQQPACNWAGIAELGRADRPTRHSWYNSFHSCTVLVQEPGHNFGMVHSSSMRCTRGTQPVPIAWPDQPDADCKHNEYGNPYDPMGGGDCFHMNGVQKAYQDWFAGCNVIKATDSGTFTIYPLESACDGPQLLQIPFPAPRRFGNAGLLTGYYLELRAPLGYRDRKLSPQVLVIVGNDVREARFTGNNNWLLDMTPQTTTLGDEALPVGQRFEDSLPGGPKFTVLSADATKAVIQVELAGKVPMPDQQGRAVCSDLTAYNPAAAPNCVAPPAAPAMPPGSAPEAGGIDAGATAPSDAANGGTDTAPVAGQDAGAGGGAPGGGTGGAGGGGGGRGPTPPSNPGPAPAGAGSSGGCSVAGGASATTAMAAGTLALLLAALRQRRRKGRN